MHVSPPWGCVSFSTLPGHVVVLTFLCWVFNNYFSWIWTDPHDVQHPIFERINNSGESRYNWHLLLFSAPYSTARVPIPYARLYVDYSVSRVCRTYRNSLYTVGSFLIEFLVQLAASFSSNIKYLWIFVYLLKTIYEQRICLSL